MGGRRRSALTHGGVSDARAALARIVYLLFAGQLPYYHTAIGLGALLDGSVLTGLVAVGVGLTMIAGELDLSVGSMAALAGVLVVKLIGIGVVPALGRGGGSEPAGGCEATALSMGENDPSIR